MKKDHAFIVNGEFVRFVPKNSVGTPVLPAGTQILPIAYGNKPTFDELTHKLVPTSGRVYGGSWLIEYNKVALSAEEAAVAFSNKYRPVTLTQMYLWLAQNYGVTDVEVEDMLVTAMAGVDAKVRADAIVRVRRIELVPIDHQLVGVLASMINASLSPSVPITLDLLKAQWSHIQALK